MVIYQRNELVKHPMLERAIVLSEKTAKVTWKSLYMDREGGIALSFYGKLSEKQVRIILKHCKELIDGKLSVNNISVQYGVDYECADNQTDIYTPEGYDFSQF